MPIPTTSAALLLAESAQQWAAGERTQADHDALEAAVGAFDRAQRGVDRTQTRADVTHSRYPDLRRGIAEQLRAHGVAPTESVVAACVTAIAGYLTMADLDRELLARLCHRVEATEVWGTAPALRELLDAAYDEADIPRPDEDGCPCYACESLRAERDAIDGEVRPRCEATDCIAVATARGLCAYHDSRTVRSNFAAFEARVAAGEDPDEAAVASGGTGRVLSAFYTGGEK
jgi:hypothetical protein